MKNKKIALIATLILSITLLCTLLLGCDAKLKKTGGTTDGSAITADTDPSKIVSQELNEEQWTSAMNAYANLQQNFGKSDPEKTAPFESCSFKATITSAGETAIIEMKSTKTAAYLKMDETETYMEYVEASDTYYIYSADAAGAFTKSVVPKATIDQSMDAIGQFAADNDFSSYKYDKKVKGYVGDINFDFLRELGIYYLDGMVGKVTIKIVNGLPCYMKQEISYYSESAVSEMIIYDFDATVIELPQVG